MKKTVEPSLIMKAPLIRMTLAGVKTQTRRIIKPEPPIGYVHRGIVMEGSKEIEGKHMFSKTFPVCENAVYARFPFGKVDDSIWIRETHGFDKNGNIVYPADGGWTNAPNYAKECLQGGKWTPSIHMFRKHSRINLWIRYLDIERLQDISEHDAK